MSLVRRSVGGEAVSGRRRRWQKLKRREAAAARELDNLNLKSNIMKSSVEFTDVP